MPFIHNLPIERQYDIGKSWMKGIELALNSQENLEMPEILLDDSCRNPAFCNLVYLASI